MKKSLFLLFIVLSLSASEIFSEIVLKGKLIKAPERVIIKKGILVAEPKNNQVVRGILVSPRNYTKVVRSYHEHYYADDPWIPWVIFAGLTTLFYLSDHVSFSYHYSNVPYTYHRPFYRHYRPCYRRYRRHCY